MTYIIIGGLVIFSFIEMFNIAENKKQIKNMQYQLNQLCRLLGHEKLVSVYLTDNEKELILHLKNSGKKVEGLKKIRELTDLDEKEAEEFFDGL